MNESTVENRNKHSLEQFSSKTVTNNLNKQDDQPVEQLKYIEEDELDNPLNTANSDRFQCVGHPQNLNSALSNFDMVFTNTANKPQDPSTQQSTPAAKAQPDSPQVKFYLFYPVMERNVVRRIGNRSVPYMLHQIWTNLDDAVKETFKTKTAKLQYAFQKKFPEIVVQSVDCDPFFKTPLIKTTTLREKLPKNPKCPLVHFRTIMTREVRQRHPKIKPAQVLQHVEQLWNTLSVDQKRRNAEEFQKAKKAYEQEMQKRPERKNSIKIMRERVQEELKPFLQYCNNIVQSYAESNHAYRTFTTPQEQVLSCLGPPKVRKRPFHDPVGQNNGRTLTKPEPEKQPVVARCVNREANNSEDPDMDTFREFFPDYPVDVLSNHPEDSVAKESISSGKPAIEQSIWDDDDWDDWNENPGYETIGFETNHEEDYPQQTGHNYPSLSVDHNTAFGRFCLLECINFNGETLKNFSDETLFSYLQNRWEETSETRKADFELIGAIDMGNISQLSNGLPNSSFDKFCNHAIKKIGLDLLDPDEVHSLLQSLWNLNPEEKKAQYNIDDHPDLNNLQVAAFYQNVEDTVVVGVEMERNIKSDQMEQSSSEFAPAVLDPANISLFET
ncbi:hypothetical protein CAEBREN_00160 [Caenorhabditis brenneri]|uniref:HMG box domain-containing protein n=1 Tax=Caenorhabditis brenneri TaxID=135651 RepID=G0N7U4_CAEBE|nr:hypothetical protein CAEBREN_00160 [Caenorhabditis brenneri]